MGARQYSPLLGRFLQTDPIEGGSCNDYDYVCSDPVGGLDLDGQVGVYSYVGRMTPVSDSGWTARMGGCVMRAGPLGCLGGAIETRTITERFVGVRTTSVCSWRRGRRNCTVLERDRVVITRTRTLTRTYIGAIDEYGSYGYLSGGLWGKTSTAISHQVLRATPIACCGPMMLGGQSYDMGRRRSW